MELYRFSPIEVANWCDTVFPLLYGELDRREKRPKVLSLNPANNGLTSALPTVKAADSGVAGQFAVCRSLGTNKPIPYLNCNFNTSQTDHRRIS